MSDRREAAARSPGAANSGTPPGPAEDRERVILLECRLEQMRSALGAAREEADSARTKLAESCAREADHARRFGEIHAELAEARAEVAALHRRLERSEALKSEIEGYLFEAGAQADTDELARLRRRVLVEDQRALVNDRTLARLRWRVEDLAATRETLLTRVAEWQQLIRKEGPDAADLSEFLAELRREILELEHRNVTSDAREMLLRERLAMAGIDPDDDSASELITIDDGDTSEHSDTVEDPTGVDAAADAARAEAPEDSMSPDDPARPETSAGTEGAPPDEPEVDAHAAEPDAVADADQPKAAPISAAPEQSEEPVEATTPDAPQVPDEDAAASTAALPEQEAEAEAPPAAEPPVVADPARPVRTEAPDRPEPVHVPLPPARTAGPRAPEPIQPRSRTDTLIADLMDAGSSARRADLLLQLGRSGDARAHNMIRPWTESLEASVRAAAYEALGRLLERAPERLEPHLRTGLSDPDARVRRRVALAAATARGLTPRRLLEPLKEDPDAQVRRVVREVLRQAPRAAQEPESRREEASTASTAQTGDSDDSGEARAQVSAHESNGNSSLRAR